MDAPVTSGQILLGKYRVERILGQGGMGMVVAVRHVELEQLRAMKFLLSGALGHAESHERFLREARAAARLSSEHVAKVLDFGRTEDGAQYMLMEYLEGCDLKVLVSRKGPLPIEIAVTYVLHVCEAMIEAHAAGIVHRDLKPANLFLVRRQDGSHYVKVLDFGISKQLDLRGIDLTKEDSPLGTPLYMSPEQMRQPKNVDERADIWALGVILYELLAGMSPFRGESIFEVTSRVLQDEPTPLHKVRKDVPLELEAVITKCLRKCRDERFQSVVELKEALAPFARAGKLSQLSVPPVVNQMDRPSGEADREDDTTSSLGQTGKPLVPQRKRSVLQMALAAWLVLMMGVGFVALRVRAKPMSMQPAASNLPMSSAWITIPTFPKRTTLVPLPPPEMTNRTDVPPAPSTVRTEKPQPPKSITPVIPKKTKTTTTDDPARQR